MSKPQIITFKTIFTVYKKSPEIAKFIKYESCVTPPFRKQGFPLKLPISTKITSCDPKNLFWSFYSKTWFFDRKLIISDSGWRYLKFKGFLKCMQLSLTHKLDLVATSCLVYGNYENEVIELELKAGEQQQEKANTFE